MRPTHLNIVGRSKFIYNRDIQPVMMEQFSHLIKKLSPGSKIIFNENVKSVDDTDAVVNFLVKKGIPRIDIRLRYANKTGHAKFRSILQKGLSESNLTFGSDVAERDEGLDRYFIETRTFQAIDTNKKHIVVGPKGSGKSAILRVISYDENHSLVITPEHYATDVLDALQNEKSSNDLSAYIITWKYTLLVEIFKQIVARQIGDRNALSHLRRYLIDHGHLSSDLTMLERFLNYLKRISQIKGKVGPVEGEFGVNPADELGKLFKMDELLNSIPSLRAFLRKNKFTVFIDELDQSWNNTETANNFLISLLTAAIQLQGISENLHVIVFLRTEIFDLLKPYLPQLDKLRSDIETIKWSRRELVNLIVSRALDSLSIHSDINAETAIKTLFPDDHGSSDINSFDYLLSRTSYRPREVIQFCNLALEEAINLDLTYISSQSVDRSEEIFSDWKRDHIVAEHMYIFPGLDEILEQFRGKTREISKNGLDSILSDIILEADNGESYPKWVAKLEPIEFMRLLYNLEIIGVEKYGNFTSSYESRWEAYDFSFSRPNAKAEISSNFLFHPGLWRGLEMI